MNTKHVQWLQEELPALVREGVLPEETAEKLRQHYGPMVKADGRRLMVLLFGILGAVLIGGGIILLLAHNWEELTRPMRAAISFAPLLGALGLAAWVMVARNESTAWREGAAAYWALSIGTTISLIAQTYNIGGEFGGFMLTWTLLGLPIVYLLRSSVTTALYWVGVTTWAVHARLSSGIELWLWPMLALGMPHLWRIGRDDRCHPRVTWLLWVLAICVSIGTGASLTDELGNGWMLIYTSPFTVMWLSGRQWFDGARRPPLQSIGAAGMLVLAVMLSFRAPWKDLTWHSQVRTIETPLFGWRLAVAALWPVAAVCLWGTALRRRDIPGAVAGLMPVLAAIGFALGGFEMRNIVMPLVFDAFLLAVGLAVIITGVRERRLGITNAGMLVLSTLIIARFFDSDLDFVVRGLVFVVVGLGFLTTNLWLVKGMKEAQ